jgi:SAM-dependent methyltransferase
MTRSSRSPFWTSIWKASNAAPGRRSRAASASASERAKTLDLAFGHGIFSPDEFKAWQEPIRATLGEKPLRVLELACGTGEITRLSHDLGHDVTALDFSEAMLDVARARNLRENRGWAWFWRMPRTRWSRTNPTTPLSAAI